MNDHFPTTTERIEDAYFAARSALLALKEMTLEGTNPVLLVTQGATVMEPWQAYPDGGVFDPRTHLHYYYHVHDAGFAPAEEHGHFHVFVLAGTTRPEDGSGQLSHLVAISLDREARPYRLFCPNRWVTGETWLSADSILARLTHLKVEGRQPDPRLNRWLSGLLRCYRQEIEALVIKRDQVLSDRRRANPDVDPLEDRTLEILVEKRIDLDDRLARLKASMV